MVRLPFAFVATMIGLLVCAGSLRAADDDPAYSASREITREQLKDRIYGGWVGSLIGATAGLPHEFKYREEPRKLLPDFDFLENGAVLDENSDVEWTHLAAVDKANIIQLPYKQLVRIWKGNMVQGVTMANLRARELMNQGVVPPDTSEAARNLYAWYHVVGQSNVDAYGLIAPGMPQVACDTALHYVRVAVSEEPLQAAQFWSQLVSIVFFDDSPGENVLRRAMGGVENRSMMADAIADARRLFAENPEDWKVSRQSIHDKWYKQRKWAYNSTPINGAVTCLAIMYGKDDFYRTLQYAMAMGYDADTNASTAGTVIGVRVGYKKIMESPHAKLVDRYENNNRPQLPKQGKISDQAEALVRIAERVILANGGEQITIGDQPGYRIKVQHPRSQEQLPTDLHSPTNRPQAAKEADKPGKRRTSK